MTFESPLTPSTDGGRGTGANAPCHLISLSVQELHGKLGAHWMLDRKRTLLNTNPQILSMFLECVPYVRTLVRALLAMKLGVRVC